MPKAAKVVLSIVLLAAVAGVAGGGFFLAKKFLGGGSAGGEYFNQVAERAPEDALVVLAVRNLEEAFNFAVQDIGSDIRQAGEDELGVDIFDAETYREWGFDFTRPSGAIFLSADPLTVAFLLPTLNGGEEQRDRIADVFTDVLDADDDDFEKDEIEDAPAILADEFVLAFRDDHAVLLFADLGYGVEDPRGTLTGYLEDFLEYDDEPFSAHEALGDAIAFRDETIAIAAGEFDQLAPFLAEFDLEQLIPTMNEQLGVIAFGLSASSAGLTLSARAPIEDEETLEVLGKAPEFGSALSQIPGPVELGLRIRFNVQVAVERALDELSATPELEEELEANMASLKEESGIDIMEDLVPLLTGEIGLVVQKIPPPSDRMSGRVTFFLGVSDEDDFRDLLENLQDFAPPGFIEVEETDSGDVFVVPMGPRVAIGVHSGYLWVTVSDQVLMDIIGGDIESFLEERDEENAADFFAQSGHLGLYIPIANAIRDALLSSDQGNEFDRTILESLELITLSSTLHGNVSETSLSIHMDTEAVAGAMRGAFQQEMRDAINSERGSANEPIPTGNAPTGNLPTGNLPTGGTPTGNAPTGNVPTGNVPTGNVPTGGTPTGGAPANVAPSVEARTNVTRITGGAVSYFARNRAFPASTPLTPSRSVLNVACATEGTMILNPELWNSGTWAELGFSPENPHRYLYQFETNGIGPKASFTTSAFGDLDCDGNFSTFRQFGKASGAGAEFGTLVEFQPSE